MPSRLRVKRTADLRTQILSVSRDRSCHASAPAKRGVLNQIAFPAPRQVNSGFAKQILNVSLTQQCPLPINCETWFSESDCLPGSASSEQRICKANPQCSAVFSKYPFKYCGTWCSESDCPCVQRPGLRTADLPANPVPPHRFVSVKAVRNMVF